MRKTRTTAPGRKDKAQVVPSRAERTPRAVRRSVALPQRLVEEVIRVAPADIQRNLNRIVTVALEEFVARRKAREFEEAMAAMAADPTIRRECEAIARDFAKVEADGLPHG